MLVLYKSANDPEYLKSMMSCIDKGCLKPKHYDKNLKFHLDVGDREKKFTNDFISKMTPFIFGVLTTLIILIFTEKF